LVHGDLSLGNLIFHDGVLRGVVDIEAVGCGTAAHDLMAGLRTAYLWPEEADDGVAPVLEQAALDMFDPDVIVTCVASQVIEILNFVLRRWPDRVEPAAGRALAWLASTRKLVGG
jgi:Phosphotransferase enzyme family